MTILLLLTAFLLHTPPCSAADGGGTWSMLNPNIGISAMHMQLLPNDRVVIYDRTSFGTSNISLPDGKCPPELKDCSAHSVEYDIGSNSVRPLVVLTDFWCSSGSLMPDGSLTQTGGNYRGAHVVRTYKSCDSCDWQEIKDGLVNERWYATNQFLPDGRQIIIGGRLAFTYEFYPKTPATQKAVDFPFLVQTNDRDENNLYPFVFLNPDGNLFIFANGRSILFNYVKNKVVRKFPLIPGDEPRNYPSTGSAVLLPLRIVKGTVATVEVLVCGGAPRSAFRNAMNKRIFDGALNTCGRIKISDPDPKWVMETMPLARVMGDMLLLPNGNVLIINGGSAGCAGWDFGRNPVLNPVIYQPGNPVGSRFTIQSPSTIPRMYHSTAILLRDGRVLVGGSNPHDKYEFRNVFYPTELSLEAFSPNYLDSNLSGLRPVIISPVTGGATRYGKKMVIIFAVSNNLDKSSVLVTMVAPSFNTHSFSMNQRLLVLDSGVPTLVSGSSNYRVTVTMPRSGNVAPKGNYMLFVVHKDVPSEGIWIRIH